MLVNGLGTENAGLNVIIVGAGIGGLSAALGLRQQGHNVTVYEQSRMSQETGAAIHLAPNCNGLLQRLGIMPRDHGSVECYGLTHYDGTGNLKQEMDLRHVNRKMWQHSWDLIHRAHLHTALREAALSSNGKGRPITLHLSASVQTVDVDKAEITLADGSTASGDLVIGADGVHSRTRRFIPGGDLHPKGCGKSAYRFLIPTADVATEPKLAPLLRHEQHLVMWIGQDRRLVMYPCSNGEQLNFVAIHPSEESSKEVDGEGWQDLGSKQRMMQSYESFGEQVNLLLSRADESRLKVWTLLDMDKMPSFVNKRLAILGDAAHPFLPHQAQGGAQAIEDALSLAALLPYGTEPEAIPDRLQIYNAQRYDRSHRIQEFTRLSGQDVVKGQQPDVQRFTAYNFGHDEWHSSTAALQKHLATKSPATKWRVPGSFGPAPGPRQPLGLALDSKEVARIREKQPEHSSLISIRFKSSRTFLQNLLPPGFSYASPATICEATLLCNTLDGMTWLGGGGYNYVMLCLHGVQYTKKDGEKLFGSFLPVLFEDLADPIITGRDDLGMPKLYASIDIHSRNDGAEIKISWRGTTFGTIAISGLTPQPAHLAPENNAESGSAPTKGINSPPSDRDGQFAWRFVPAVGQPGKADAEYAICVPPAEPNKYGKDPQVEVTTDASFVFRAHDWTALPTIHNTARVLAEMPNYEIVEAKRTISKGCDDLNRAYRIE